MVTEYYIKININKYSKIFNLIKTAALYYDEMMEIINGNNLSMAMMYPLPLADTNLVTRNAAMMERGIYLNLAAPFRHTITGRTLYLIPNSSNFEGLQRVLGTHNVPIFQICVGVLKADAKIQEAAKLLVIAHNRALSGKKANLPRTQLINFETMTMIPVISGESITFPLKVIEKYGKGWNPGSISTTPWPIGDQG